MKIEMSNIRRLEYNCITAPHINYQTSFIQHQTSSHAVRDWYNDTYELVQPVAMNTRTYIEIDH